MSFMATGSKFTIGYDQLMAAKKEPEALDDAGLDLKTESPRFFDEVMVMVDEPDVRANRLALLASIHLDADEIR